MWLAEDAGKRWTEVFFLAYSPFWMLWALCILVPFRLYEHLSYLGYLLVGVAAAAPCFLLPLWLQPLTEARKPLLQRHWVKANIWMAIFSYIGNYFWTHYFYTLLGAQYTFHTWRLNDVPIALYLMTHAYFCFYHALANVCLRRTSNAVPPGPARLLAMGTVVVLLAYATAFMETLTISHFPYYSFKDKSAMYLVGSLFYAIYFFASFPMYFRMDERPRHKWTAGQAAVDSLAAGMLVTILLDLWRLFVGSIWETGNTSSGLPWLHKKQ